MIPIVGISFSQIVVKGSIYHKNTWKGETLCTTQQEACISHGVTCCYCTLRLDEALSVVWNWGVARRNATVADVHLPHKDDTRKGPKVFGQRHFGLCRIRKGIHHIYFFCWRSPWKIAADVFSQRSQRARISIFICADDEPCQHNFISIYC